MPCSDFLRSLFTRADAPFLSICHPKEAFRPTRDLRFDSSHRSLSILHQDTTVGRRLVTGHDF